MGSGLPVVATAVGGVPRALRGGELGLLVPPDDKDALVAAIQQLRRRRRGPRGPGASGRSTSPGPARSRPRRGRVAGWLRTVPLGFAAVSGSAEFPGRFSSAERHGARRRPAPRSAGHRRLPHRHARQGAAAGVAAGVARTRLRRGCGSRTCSSASAPTSAGCRATATRSWRRPCSALDDLLSHQQPGGGWPHGFAYPHSYVLPAGWVSGITQGEAASFLVRMHKATGEDRYADAAAARRSSR